MKQMEEEDLKEYMKNNPTKFCQCQFKFEENILEVGYERTGSYRYPFFKDQIVCRYYTTGGECTFKVIEMNDKYVKLKCNGLGKEILFDLTRQ